MKNVHLCYNYHSIDTDHYSYNQVTVEGTNDIYLDQFHRWVETESVDTHCSHGPTNMVAHHEVSWHVNISNSLQTATVTLLTSISLSQLVQVNTFVKSQKQHIKALRVLLLAVKKLNIKGYVLMWRPKDFMHTDTSLFEWNKSYHLRTVLIHSERAAIHNNRMPRSLLQWNVMGKYNMNALCGEPRADAASINSL